MSSLRSAVDDLLLADTDDYTIEELGEQLQELSRISDSLESVKLRFLHAFEQRGGHEIDGYVSVTSWLKDRCGFAGSAARARVRVSRALPHMPLTSAALADGDVSYTAVRLLADARDAHPDVFGEHEETLLEAARTLRIRGLRKAIAYWRQALDWDAAIADANHLYEMRRLHLSRSFGGTGRLDGVLDPEGTELVSTALGAVLDGEVRSGSEDARTPAQQRADALVEICRQWLDDGSAKVSGGERPHLSVLVDLEVLEGRAGGTAETESGRVLHPETLRRLACDAGLCRVVTQGGSEPLDVGRRTRTIPPALRRAVVARDRGCAFPGCDRPPSWCDCHHVVHWADGGPTSLGNLVLLCRRHHRLVHEGRFTIVKSEGGLHFAGPGGAILRQGRSPP